MARPKKYNISLTDDELKELKSVMRKKQTTKTVRNRCQIIIDLDEAHGKVLTHAQSAKTNCVCMATIMNTVKLYSEKKGIQGIRTMNRNVNSDNARRKFDGRAEARIIEIACSPAPEGHSRWTLRLLEEQAKIVLDVPVSKDTIGGALKKNKLRPHMNDYWCIPSKEDADFVALHGRCP
ncbi:helix-turn-helix domain-containing protein [Roseburia intestinalis]